jgi:hypothetical protein
LEVVKAVVDAFADSRVAEDVRLPLPVPPRPFPLSNSAELHMESLLCNAANRLLVVVGGGEDNGEFVINIGAEVC